jgi:hypothetical protein
VTVTITGLNQAPVLEAIDDITVDEGETIEFTAAASDPGQCAADFSLDVGAPAGASIDPLTGEFTWTPSEAQGPDVFTVTVRVTDDADPALEDTETLTITVNEINAAPVLAEIDNQTVNEGETLSFTAVASDSDSPANELVFSLDPGAPAGASIDADSGALTWTPTESDGPGFTR